jgi:hypothetical protein|tara:strand:+ start:4720 stop:4968 length:249 start_codon:yes stop_codon:yes gene_type:complete
MAAFKVTEVSFEPIDFSPTLEDEFTMTAVSKEIESVDDIDQLKLGALNLLKVAVHRQAVIRGLCKRLAKIETYGVTTTKHQD